LVDTILPDGAGQRASIVDISARAVDIVIEGARAVEVWRSFAPWLWQALLAAAAD
jgi:sarcosine oxidase gamma subunit